MAKVQVIVSTMRYGSNGFKHLGEEFNLPDDVAKEKAALGLVKILSTPVKKAKVEKAPAVTKELKEPIQTK